MWGAVTDTKLLENNHTDIISLCLWSNRLKLRIQYKNNH